MATHLYIVTGASRGIGKALATKLDKDPESIVLRIARNNPEALEHFLTIDLTDIDTIPEIINWIDENRQGAASITLINNAGMVEPIGLIGSVNAHSIQNAVALNITAPIALTNAFIEALEDFPGEKYVLNISSGAGRKAYLGWGVYCMTKAALDHFTRVVFEEQKSVENPVYIASIAPGVIDTDMQSVIRSSSIETFPLVERFISLKEEELLSSPEETAQKLIRFRHSDAMKTTPIADVRDYD